MRKRTWRDTKGHHWMDKHTRSRFRIWKELYLDFTTPMSGEEHRDAQKYGIRGAISRFAARRWAKRKQS